MRLFCIFSPLPFPLPQEPWLFPISSQAPGASDATQCAWGKNGLPQGGCWPSVYLLQVNGGLCGNWDAPGDFSARGFQTFSFCSAQIIFSPAHPSIASASCSAGPEALNAISCPHLVEMKKGQELKQQGTRHQKGQRQEK